MTIGLKSTYLLDALAVIREDYISLDFERSISPIVVRGIPESNQQKQFFKHMIMPLKI
jgi:DNA polymerase III sliding clamp (beta) subunit (PCNA family)